jgi:hypothetical protein
LSRQHQHHQHSDSSSEILPPLDEFIKKANANSPERDMPSRRANDLPGVLLHQLVILQRVSKRAEEALVTPACGMADRYDRW